MSDRSIDVCDEICARKKKERERAIDDIVMMSVAFDADENDCCDDGGRRR